jgi:hypothetical protein
MLRLSTLSVGSLFAFVVVVLVCEVSMIHNEDISIEVVSLFHCLVICTLVFFMSCCLVYFYEVDY